MDQEFIYLIVSAILAGIGTVVRQWVKTNLTPQRLNALGELVHVVVAGAEEVGRVLELGPDEKYEYAENALRDAAKTLGLRLSDAELNAYIHALLYGLHASEAAGLDLPEAPAEDPVAA